MEISSARWQTIFIFNNTVYGRSLIVTSHVWACRIVLSLLLWAPGTEKYKIFRKFCPNRVIAGIQQFQCYYKWLETNENLPMNVNQYGDKRNGFAKVAAFCHVTCRYFDRFLLQGIDRNQHQAWFLKIVSVRMSVYVHVYLCMCPPLRLLITGGVMWHDMDPIWLVKQVLQLLCGNCSHYC